MRRRLIVYFASVILSILLSGCRGGNPCPDPSNDCMGANPGCTPRFLDTVIVALQGIRDAVLGSVIDMCVNLYRALAIGRNVV